MKNVSAIRAVCFLVLLIPGAVAGGTGAAGLPILSWNTVIGGTGNDSSSAIALDSAGNIYVVGQSDASWGTPIRAFSGNDDVFVAKLRSDGTLLWNTFLGGSAYDTGHGVGLDAGGNIYVSGQSEGTWGSPVRAFSAGIDEFVVKLSPSGALLWSTFLGGAGYDGDGYMAVDPSGNCYLAGWSDASWGAPVRPFNAVPAGFKDMSVAKVTSNGILQWNTFLGGAGYDNAGGVALDGSGGLVIAGASDSSWGTPVNAYAAASDIAVAKINASDGVLQWNAFFGGAGYDYALGITVSPQGLLLIAGTSDATWGSPVNAYAGGSSDGTVVVLDGNGILQWHTFLGGSGKDDAGSVAVSGTGAIYVLGSSLAGWGSPDRPFSGNTDGFVARLNTAGRLQALTFVGGVDYDWGDALAVDNNRNVYVAGTTATNYIPPDRPQAASFDSFVDKLSFIPDVLNRAAVGNFDNNGVMAAVMNFPGLGVWKYSAGSWTQISPNYAEELAAADVDGDGVDEIVGDFGASGLWLRQGGAWTQLSSYDVEELAVDDINVDNKDELFCDFGALGIWVLGSGVWFQVGGSNPSHIAVKHGIAPDLTAQNILVADFGALGLWWRIVFNQYGVPAGSWSELSGADADFFVSGDLVVDNRIACDFGTLGLWLAEGSGWTELSGLDANYLIMTDMDWDQVNEIVGDFGAVGLWLWNSGTWSQLSGQREEFMIAADANGDLHKELFVDFGKLGLWEYAGGTWTQLSGVNPEYMLAGDFDGDFQAELMVDFGSLGLWLWNYGTWTQLTGVNPN